MKGHSPIRFSMSYAQGLAEYGFNFHSIIRPEYKINYKRLDWYMNNLVRSKKVDVAFACIEPDIDKYTFKPSGYNHIHFAYKGNRLTRGEASRIIRCKDYFLRDIIPVYNDISHKKQDEIKHLQTLDENDLGLAQDLNKIFNE